MDLTDLAPVERVFPAVKAASKKQLLQELSQRLAPGVGVEPRTMFEALLERESLGATGVGRGVAIPHCRLAGLADIAGAFARLTTPVDFEAVDGRSVDLVFVLAAPECAGADHLKALARISRVLRDQDVCEKLRGAADAATLHTLLISQEHQAAA